MIDTAEVPANIVVENDCHFIGDVDSYCETVTVSIDFLG